MLKVGSGSCTDNRARFSARAAFAVAAFTHNLNRIKKTFFLAAVAAVGIVLEPFVKVKGGFLGEHLKRKVIIERILENTLHEKSRTHAVIAFKICVCVVCKSLDAAVKGVSVTEIVKITEHEIIAPEFLGLTVLAAVDIENEKSFLGNGFHNLLTQRPALHNPYGVLVKILIHIVDCSADLPEVTACFD